MAEGLNVNGIELGANAIATGIKYLQLHSADPGESGDNECTSARKSVTLSSDDGSIIIPLTNFTGLQGNEAVKYLGYWSQLTGGTFYGYNAIDGDQSANAAGEYRIEASTIGGEAS